MAQITRQSKVKTLSKSEVPVQFSEACVLLDYLRGSATVEGIGERCEIRRQGGFAGLDVALFLVAYFAGNPGTGLRGFYAAAAQWWPLLAALAGRIRLPTPPTVSRALSAAESPAVHKFGRWLLTESLDLARILKSPVTQYLDAKGRVWQIFHFDPTTSVLRQRALPARMGVPEAVRRAEGLALPGRSGRKRGEVRFTRSVLQHAGSGLWLDMRVEPGHGESREQLGSALDAVVEVCAGIGHAPEFALTCADGQWGGIPSIAAFRVRNTRFVTRCSRYQLLEEPEIRRKLNTASWFLVPDSGSGPQRSCADVGWVLLQPAADTRRSDGSAYAPERVRLIVTRYSQREGVEKAKKGSMIDETVYELFITDLDEQGWPPDVVCSTYFGRCGQENRFSQEDREFALDRIYSYSPAGQELAAVVGAFVWNWRIIAGFSSLPPNADAMPSQTDGVRPSDPRPFLPLPVEAEPEIRGEPSSSAKAEDGGAESTVPAKIDLQQLEVFRDVARAEIHRHLPVLFAGSHLQRKGWSLDKHRGHLLCPNREVFVWYSAQNNPKGTSPQAFFRTSRDGTCSTCALKQACRRDPESRSNYRPTLVIPPAIESIITTPTDLKLAPPITRAAPPPLLRPASQVHGHLEPRPSCLLPAATRKATRRHANGISVVIHLTLPSPPGRPHPFIEPCLRRRRHGRCTKAENLARYALPANARLTIERTGTPADLAFLTILDRGLGQSSRSVVGGAL